MKPFSLDWWWDRYLGAHNRIRDNVHARLISTYPTYHEQQVQRYVILRDYIRKRIEAKVVQEHAIVKGEPLFATFTKDHPWCEKGVHHYDLSNKCMLCGEYSEEIKGA